MTIQGVILFVVFGLTIFWLAFYIRKLRFSESNNSSSPVQTSASIIKELSLILNREAEDILILPDEKYSKVIKPYTMTSKEDICILFEAKEFNRLFGSGDVKTTIKFMEREGLDLICPIKDYDDRIISNILVASKPDSYFSQDEINLLKHFVSRVGQFGVIKN